MARVRQEATCLQRPLRLGDGCCLRYALLLYPGDRSCTLSFGSWGPRHERQHCRLCGVKGRASRWGGQPQVTDRPMTLDS